MAEVVYRVGGLYIEHHQESLMLTLTTEARILRATFMHDEILRLTNVFLSISGDYLDYLIKSKINILNRQKQELKRLKEGGLPTEEQEKAIRENEKRLEELQRVQSLLAKTEGSITELLKARGI